MSPDKKTSATHRCAVCWERSADHDAWLTHAEVEHGSELVLFGYGNCKQTDNLCPGIQHDKRLPNEGMPRAPRSWPEPTPIQAKDGTVYTPQRLWDA